MFAETGVGMHQIAGASSELTPHHPPTEIGPAPSAEPGQTVRVVVPAGEVARAGLVVLGLGLGVYVLWHIHEVIFLLFLAILLATAIEPIVKLLRRGPFGRGTGVLAV
jgi:hypothetical protein